MLKHASIFISLTLAMLYSYGLSFHQGFLEEIGLEEVQFGLSPDRTFFHGFLLLANWGSENFGLLIGVALGGPLLVGWIYVADKFSAWVKKGWASKHKNAAVGAPEQVEAGGSEISTEKSDAQPIESGSREGEEKGGEKPQRELDKLSESIIDATPYLLAGVGVFFFVITTLYLAWDTGRSKALGFKEDADSGEIYLKEIRVNNTPDCLYGYSVICNSSECAYWVSPATLVLNKSDIEWVRSIGKVSIGKIKESDKACKLVKAEGNASPT